MESTVDFVNELKALDGRISQQLSEAETKVNNHVLGWRPIYQQLADLQTHVAMSLEEYDGENPVEDRLLTDDERGLYRAAENWWDSIQRRIAELNKAVAAARRAIQ